MQHYKVPNDPNPHCIDPEFAYMLPPGAVPITDAEAEAMRPKPDAATIIEAKKEAVRLVREGILNRLSGIAVAAQLEGDEATTAAYLTVRAGLLDITKGWPADIELIDATVQERYIALAAQCTPQMIGAFAQVDA